MDINKTTLDELVKTEKYFQSLSSGERELPHPSDKLGCEQLVRCVTLANSVYESLIKYKYLDKLVEALKLASQEQMIRPNGQQVRPMDEIIGSNSNNLLMEFLYKGVRNYDQSIRDSITQPHINVAYRTLRAYNSFLELRRNLCTLPEKELEYQPPGCMSGILKVVGTGLIGFGLLALIALYSNDSTENRHNQPPTKQERTIHDTTADKKYEESKARWTIVHYLALPERITDDFMHQLKGIDAELEVYNLYDNKLYLTVDPSKLRESIEKLTNNPQNVEHAKRTGKGLTLGKFTYSDTTRYFFRFPFNDFRVDNVNSSIKADYGNIHYNVTLNELSDFLVNRSIYGGYSRLKIGKNQDSTPKVITNAGRIVAKKGESSLTGLVDQIIGNLTEKEDIAQALLDFVTANINNTPDESMLKRPNETLMNRSCNKSSMAALYASLLEQTDINYCLVYYANQVAVAVEGSYTDKNNSAFKYGDVSFSVVDPTIKRFEIGTTPLNTAMNSRNIRGIQKPAPFSDVYDPKTGKALEFVH